MGNSRLHQLSELGQSVWIDSLSRGWLKDGELARMMSEDAVVGVTSNPTIFQKAMAEGEWYDDQLREVVKEHDDTKEIFLQLAVEDIKDACDLFRPVWDESEGAGRVRLAGGRSQLRRTRPRRRSKQAIRFHEWVDRPNLHVKIPATQPGLAAIEEMISRGRNINVTLIFSLQRHQEVAEAYIRGLERLVEAGGDPSTVASVASFFVSRVDTEADRRLDEVGHPELKGKLAIANAKLAYQNYKQTFSGERWEALAAKGASKQRCLWASTSTKNPDYRDVMYVEELIGPETVDTMPEGDGRGVPGSRRGRAHARSRTWTRRIASSSSSPRRAWTTTTSARRSSAKASRSSATRSRELLEGIEAKRGQLAPA